MSDLSTDGLNRSLTNATALYPMDQGCFHAVHILFYLYTKMATTNPCIILNRCMCLIKDLG